MPILDGKITANQLNNVINSFAEKADNRFLLRSEYSGITIDSALSSTSQNPVQNSVIYSALDNKVDKVSGKGLSTNDYTTTEKNKLSGIATGANNYTHPSYTSKSSGFYKVTVDNKGHVSGASNVTKSDITNLGIPAQDTVYTHPAYINKSTSGLYKIKIENGHISEATAATKSDIGLGNVDNKSSATIRGEITSSNVITALGYTPLNSLLKGASNGLAELDDTGKIPSSQLPSYVDDVLEGYLYNNKFYADSSYDTLYAGESGKIYVNLSDDKSYRYTGSGYREIISSGIVLGETSSTAYRGDRGKIAYDHSQIAHAPSNAEANVQSDWNITNTASDAYIKNKPTSMPASDVYSWAKASTKPTYTKSEIGLDKVDNTADADKSVKYAATAGTANALSRNMAGGAVARCVWFSDATDAGKLVYDDDFKYNPSTNTLTVGTISGNIDWSNITNKPSSYYTHPTTSGYKHIPSGGSSGQFLGWSSDGIATWVTATAANIGAAAASHNHAAGSITSGTLSVARGGTGLSSPTAGYALITNGSSAFNTRSISNNTSTSYISASTNLITANTLAYWDGRYNNSSSRLAYCNKGSFGTLATYDNENLHLHVSNLYNGDEGIISITPDNELNITTEEFSVSSSSSMVSSSGNIEMNASDDIEIVADANISIHSKYSDISIFTPSDGGGVIDITADGDLNLSSRNGIINADGYDIKANCFKATYHQSLSSGRDITLASGEANYYGNGLWISNPTTPNDQAWVRILGTGESDTILEIATGDDGQQEQIVVRQYNTDNNPVNSLWLLNYNGDMVAPKYIYFSNGNSRAIGTADTNYLLPDKGLNTASVDGLEQSYTIGISESGHGTKASSGWETVTNLHGGHFVGQIALTCANRSSTSGYTDMYIRDRYIGSNYWSNWTRVLTQNNWSSYITSCTAANVFAALFTSVTNYYAGGTNSTTATFTNYFRIKISGSWELIINFGRVMCTNSTDPITVTFKSSYYGSYYPVVLVQPYGFGTNGFFGGNGVNKQYTVTSVNANSFSFQMGLNTKMNERSDSAFWMSIGWK